MYSVRPSKWNKGGRPLGGRPWGKYILILLIIIAVIYLRVHGIQINDKIYYIRLI